MELITLITAVLHLDVKVPRPYYYESCIDGTTYWYTGTSIKLPALMLLEVKMSAVRMRSS